MGGSTNEKASSEREINIWKDLRETLDSVDQRNSVPTTKGDREVQKTSTISDNFTPSKQNHTKGKRENEPLNSTTKGKRENEPSNSSLYDEERIELKQLLKETVEYFRDKVKRIRRQDEYRRRPKPRVDLSHSGRNGPHLSFVDGEWTLQLDDAQYEPENQVVDESESVLSFDDKDKDIHEDDEELTNKNQVKEGETKDVGGLMREVSGYVSNKYHGSKVSRILSRRLDTVQDETIDTLNTAERNSNEGASEIQARSKSTSSPKNVSFVPSMGPLGSHRKHTSTTGTGSLNNTFADCDRSSLPDKFSTSYVSNGNPVVLNKVKDLKRTQKSKQSRKAENKSPIYLNTRKNLTKMKNYKKNDGKLCKVCTSIITPGSELATRYGQFHKNCVRCDVCRIVLGGRTTMKLRAKGKPVICKPCNKQIKRSHKAAARRAVFKETPGATNDYQSLIKKGHVKVVQVEIGDDLERSMVGMIPLCSKCGLQLVGDDRDIGASGMEKFHITCPSQEEISKRKGADIRRLILGLPGSVPVKVHTRTGKSKTFFFDLHQKSAKEALKAAQGDSVTITYLPEPEHKDKRRQTAFEGLVASENDLFKAEVRGNIGPFVMGDYINSSQTKQSGNIELTGAYEHGLLFKTSISLRYKSKRVKPESLKFTLSVKE